ncbi:2-dehydro-3-deoxygalactonokinase [Mesorhizobium sp. NBSH29]|uniref:2-dehydro-3-deoxygalactonokinase n=1 Tax=Mesorhizobium sp. NBSH29 TaxID=2654249 RepID=UPI001896608C|nr:2-dehydro-3-deoxygalactonokinase [Mesorhizobium sp. NBSH29]QPC87193.1 2-dehydro-3-deoxygalactonokinase [Mesorhizobium sp. NBSH29]
MDRNFAAADWGTSHLRIWLMDAKGTVLAERRSAEGLLNVGAGGFSAVLEKHLADMGADAATPVIVCGMAGARQGWVEAPYAFVPTPLRDVLGQALPVPGLARDVRIVPGIAQTIDGAPDVMRGEETQLAGVAALHASGSHTVCMPGTHSKWVAVDNGAVTRFATFMTGELFSVLTKQSILRHAVGPDAVPVTADNPTFKKWLGEALADPAAMTARLFRIRASTLLAGMKPEEAAAALSGLLIGTEIGAASASFGLARGQKIVLVASGRLADLYAEAVAGAGYECAITDADLAVRAGLLEAARRNFFAVEGMNP